MYVYVCMYVYIHTCIFTYIYMYVCIYVYVYICIYVYMYMYMHVIAVLRGARPHSELLPFFFWLYRRFHQRVEEKLKEHARAAQVSADRLVFAGRFFFPWILIFLKKKKIYIISICTHTHTHTHTHVYICIYICMYTCIFIYMHVYLCMYVCRMPDHAAHLARHVHADLFLDTAPFGGHSTLADVVVAAVPALV